jgi:hypothetical protein
VDRRPPQLRRALFSTVLVVLAAGIGVSACNAAATRKSAAAPLVKISASPVGPAVPNGFLGMSLEYKGLEAYAGTNPGAIDGPFVQLLRNLSPDGNFILRVGGDSTDWTWWPVAHLAQPGGAKFSLTPAWASVAKALITALKGHLILGVNFEADSRPVAAGMANALLSHIGASSIDAFELGNEPELYAGFSWYKTAAGVPVFGRATGYDPEDYFGDYANIAGAMPNFPLAGPSSGSAAWLSTLGTFAARERRLSLITVHAYPLKHCTKTEISTPQDFFDGASLQGLANQIGGWTQTAAAHHLPLRVDEMNSVSCGGQNGLSQSFAPALWALDVLPRILRAGATGVNFDTIPGTWQSLISATQTKSGWRVAVQPEYYGLLTFSAAAPAGSRMLHYSAPNIPGLDVWATRATNGVIHVVLIDTTSHAISARVSIAGSKGNATLTRLSAPGLTALSSVSLGGETISPTTGLLSGTPATTQLPAANGAYANGTFSVTLPGAGAAILTLG